MSGPLSRIVWYAGTRGETLLLGPAFKEFRARKHGSEVHRFITTGEQGTQLIQALDALALRPDDAMELLPPDDDPAIRMRKLMETIEQDTRRNRSSHLIFSGFGPTAAACALVAHARKCPALWLRPADPCDLIPRSRWEAGLAKVIAALDCVTIEDAARLPSDGIEPSVEVSIAGRRVDAPLILVSIGRAEWGWKGVLGKLVNALAGAARAMPETDFLILLSMDMRLHAPLRSMDNRPPNLLSTSPLPVTDYLALLGSCRLMLTDSPHVAAECHARNLPVLTLGEVRTEVDANFKLTPDDLNAETLTAHVRACLLAGVREGHHREPAPDLIGAGLSAFVSTAQNPRP